MDLLLLTKSETFIIGPVATLLGYIMDAIFYVTNLFGIVNIGLGIIIFTIVIKLLMFPMTISQQKFSKMSAFINPEIQAIQAKYKDKKDQESMMKQNMEMTAVYDKYGSKPTAGCLPMLIQFPILFALYRVVWNVPAYVNSVKSVYMEVVDNLKVVLGENWASNELLTKYAAANRVSLTNNAFAGENQVIDMLYNFDKNEWAELINSIPGLNIDSQVSQIEKMNSFFGLSLYNSPWTYLTEFKSHGIAIVIAACIIPLLAGALQWISVKVSQSNQKVPEQKKTRKLGEPEEENPMMQSMKMMTNIMPIMSIVFCFTFSTCIGIYWIMSSFVTIICQIIVNKYMDKMDINEIIKKNMDKVNAKRAKQGLPPQKISTVTAVDAKSIEVVKAESEAKKQEYDNKIKNSTDYYNNASSSYKPGSLAAKANMVKQYDEKKHNK